MGAGTNPHSPRIQEDGDETRTEAATVAATVCVAKVIDVKSLIPEQLL
jgi:hypothetical protein